MILYTHCSNCSCNDNNVAIISCYYGLACLQAEMERLVRHCLCVSIIKHLYTIAGTYEMKEKGKEVALRFFEEETVA